MGSSPEYVFPIKDNTFTLILAAGVGKPCFYSYFFVNRINLPTHTGRQVFL